VASGTSEHTRVVIDHGAVPKFVQLLASASDDVREQVISSSSLLRRFLAFFPLPFNFVYIFVMSVLKLSRAHMISCILQFSWVAVILR